LIPQELQGGQYVRNGGNPITNQDLRRDYHWFDGDGMLTGVLFERSNTDPKKTIPLFTNQYIITDLCKSSSVNPQLRNPILPSIATLVNPASTLLTTILRILRSVFLVLLSQLPGSQQAIKRISVANTGIYYHDRRALATCESGPPIRIQLPSLRTVGWLDGNKAEGEASPISSSNRRDSFRGKGLLGFMREWTTGHPKIDPWTGELVLFHCNFNKPYVHYSVIPPNEPEPLESMMPKLVMAPVPGCSGGKMMHDFGVSHTSTVILDLPLSLTPLNLLQGQPLVRYRPEKPSRFGVFPRRCPAKVRWYETEGCCIFHTANTWDEYNGNNKVIAVSMLACRMTSATAIYVAGNIPSPSPPSLAASTTSSSANQDNEKAAPFQDAKGKEEQCRLYYYRFSLISTQPRIESQYALSAIPFEFPTLNPAYEMFSARYIYGCSTTVTSFGAALGKADKIDVLVKMDVQSLLRRGQAQPPTSVTGCVDVRSIAEVLATADDHDSIRPFVLPLYHYAQEARFVSRKEPIAEDDGFLLFYVFDETQLDADGGCLPNAVSELWILDAKDMRDVVARVRLPQRVPYGLHGNWFSERQIAAQREVESFRTLPSDKRETNWKIRLKAALIHFLG
jgi:carotenoid cleavage dioxygenase-like enzyme